MKKDFFSVIAAIGLACIATNTTFAQSQLTGNNGDSGDPNNNLVAAAAAAAAATPPSPAEIVIPAPAAVSTPAVVSTPVVVSTPEPVSATAAPAATTSAASVPATTASEVTPVNTSVNTSVDAFGSTPNNRTAFTKVVRNLMPLNPAQIVTLRNMFDTTQRAVSQFPGTPPKPTSSSILVSMSPGATPPVIRLRAGYVTSLVFLDSTGQPWPVVGFDLGNPKAFNIQPSAPDGKSDMLIVQAMDRYEQGNLAVMLKGENTPVMLTLIPGQRAVDYRVDLRMPGLGPNATIAMSGLPQAENPALLDFLDGIAPTGARMVTIEGAPAQGWILGGHLFLRTRVTVLSPGWISSMSSPDGTHVYELVKTPVVLASQRGAMLQLSIKGL